MGPERGVKSFEKRRKATKIWRKKRRADGCTSQENAQEAGELAQMLKKIIDVQKVGRFEKLEVPSSLCFSKTTLIFGENGWGKSTIADILRSFGSGRPEIIRGRKTLATDGVQKIILLFAGSSSRQAIFENAAWKGTPPPPIAVFDQIFINENVFSGEIISHDHLTRQYSLVMGEDGVAMLREIQKTEAAEEETKDKLKEQKQAIQIIIAGLGLSLMSPADFAVLDPLDAAATVIESKATKLKQAKERWQIQKAILPEPFPVPTSAAELISTLKRSVEGIAAEAREQVQSHIAAHAKEDCEPSIPHETWLEAGLAFSADETCAFCGQDLRDRDLVDLYGSYFSAAFKALAEDVGKQRQTLAGYEAGDFREAFSTTMRANIAAIENLTNLTKESFSGRIDDAPLIAQFKEVAKDMAAAFLAKQEDLVSTPDLAPLAAAFKAWDKGRDTIKKYNRAVQDYRDNIEEIRVAQESANVEELTDELAVLEARMKRHETETDAIVAAYTGLLAEQKRLQDLKDKPARGTEVPLRPRYRPPRRHNQWLPRTSRSRVSDQV